MPGEPTPGGADAAAAELCVVPPEQFVARRKELVAELRAAGERAAAADLAKVRRPPRSAWALNVAARDRPDLVAAVLAAAAAATDALAAGSDGLRDALASYRAATEELLDAAADATDTHGVDWRDRMRATVQAAGDDPDLADLLTAGRLSDDHAAAGLGGSAAATTIAARRPRRAPTAGARARRVPGSAPASEPDPAAAAAAKAAAAAQAAERARKEAERARVATERARLIRELDRARTRAERLQRTADEARAAADEATRAADEIEARLRRLAQ